MSRICGNLTGLKRIGAALLAVLLLFGGSFPADLRAEGKPPAPSAASELYQSLSSGKRVPVPAVAAAAGGSGDATSGASVGASAASEDKIVYLTFDDGPSKLTPEVLDILRQEKVKATFFELGELAELRPQLVQRVVAEGHALGNHSYDHVYKELYNSFDSFWQQISRTEDIFYRITGTRPELVRPPGGSYTNFDSFYFYLLEQAGYRVFDWNVDSTDATRRGVPAAAIEQAVLGAPLKSRMVVLMHDGAGHEESVKALPAIIRHFKENGYRFAKLDATVAPVQFRLGKVKWQRTMGLGAFEKLLAAAREHRALLTQEQAKSASSPTEPTVAPVQEPAAAVKGGEGKEPGGGQAGSGGANGAGGVSGTGMGPGGMSGLSGLGEAIELGGMSGLSGLSEAIGLGGLSGLSGLGEAMGLGGMSEPMGLSGTGGAAGLGGASGLGGAGGSPASDGLGGTFGPAGGGGSSLSPETDLPAPESGKLQVRLNGKTWIFQGDGYELDGGRFSVSLSALADMLGGRYYAEPVGGRSIVQVGFTRLTIPKEGMSVAVEVPGKAPAVYPLIKMAARPGGDSRIALRTAIELAGGSIAGFAVSGTGGVVAAECPERMIYFSQPVL